MRSKTFLFLALFTTSFASSCYLETISDRERDARGPNNNPTTTPEPNGEANLGPDEGCQTSETAGCFEGEIAAAPDIVVDGKPYFDAEDLRKNFAELIEVQNTEGVRMAPEDYELTVNTEFDNKTFGRDFVVYLKGEIATNAKVWSKGRFEVDRLPEGDYEIRLARPIVYEVKKKAIAADPENPDVIARDEEVTKLCAVLYTETEVQIEAGRVSREVFDNYQLHIDEEQCTAQDVARRIRI